MGKTYQEDNCIERRHFTKTVSTGSYQLHHTTHLGWGYVYIVQQLDQSSLAVMPPPPPSLYVTDRKLQLVSSPISISHPCVHQSTSVPTAGRSSSSTHGRAAVSTATVPTRLARSTSRSCSSFGTHGCCKTPMIRTMTLQQPWVFIWLKPWCGAQE